MIDQIWANAAIKRCLQQGIDHFFLAPGSRCTPLTLAVARHNEATVVQHFDERGLAFAALGYGRATGKPGVFICTSGTAVANAFPAVIEASTECVPLLLFTADRPGELRGSGANQTIDQQEIFGRYPKLFLDMPVPGDTLSSDDPEGMTFMEGKFQDCFAAVNSGPVHVNWMFREPFTIDETESEKARVLSADSVAPNKDDISIEFRGNVLIALGNCNPDEAAQALMLSQKLNCPMLSDITSGLRTGSFELPSEFDLPQPDTILHLGGRIVSKSWLQWTDSLRDKGVSFIHVSPTEQNINPNHLKQQRIQTSLTDLALKISGSPCSDSFLEAWQSAASQRSKIVEDQLSETSMFSEPAIAHFVSKECPQLHGLFLGNSTPIRDMDWFGTGCSDQPRFVDANRGASGIDGLIATATGYATGLVRPMTLVLGDLSALHDLNSLSLVANCSQPLIIIVINNQAGHIFDLLPIHDSKHFEKFFATPHNYHFEHAATMFGIEYSRIDSMAAFRDRYHEALTADRSVVLELITDRQTNLEVRKSIKDEIAKCAQR